MIDSQRGWQAEHYLVRAISHYLNIIDQRLRRSLASEVIPFLVNGFPKQDHPCMYLRQVCAKFKGVLYFKFVRLSLNLITVHSSV
jgi:hypothetical protein